MPPQCAAEAPIATSALSGEHIGSPLIEPPDMLVAMTEILLRKFAPQIEPAALILYDREALPEDFRAPHGRVHCVPAAELADKLGGSKVTTSLESRYL